MEEFKKDGGVPAKKKTKKGKSEEKDKKKKDGPKKPLSAFFLF